MQNQYKQIKKTGYIGEDTTLPYSLFYDASNTILSFQNLLHLNSI